MLIPISGEAMMIFVGLASYLIACLVTRNSLTWAWALLPGFLLSVTLESWEISETYGSQSLAMLWSPDMLGVAARHSRDVLIANLAPVAVFTASHALVRLRRPSWPRVDPGQS